MQEWIDAAIPILQKNVQERQPMKWSTMKENKVVAKADSMIAVIENVDQNRDLHMPHNTP